MRAVVLGRQPAVRLPSHTAADQVVSDPAEQVNLKAWNGRAPQDGSNAHQMAFATPGRAAVKNLRRLRVERDRLLRMKA